MEEIYLEKKAVVPKGKEGLIILYCPGPTKTGNSL